MNTAGACSSIGFVRCDTSFPECQDAAAPCHVDAREERRAYRAVSGGAGAARACALQEQRHRHAIRIVAATSQPSDNYDAANAADAVILRPLAVCRGERSLVAVAGLTVHFGCWRRGPRPSLDYS